MGADKIAHLGVYLILTIFIIWTLAELNSKAKLKKGIIAASTYGLVMEILQLLFYTGRNFEFLDIIANIIGSFLGAIFFNLFVKYFKLWKD